MSTSQHALYIYNSLTQQKELFKPLKEGEISLYVCGITVYDHCHLGHARVFVAFDVIVRFLRSSGWKVKYVRNITDIDDKIIKRAQENNEKIEGLTARFIDAMNQDAKALNVLSPDEEPRATESIDTIISMIKRLQEKDYAYVADNQDVYFQVDRFASYGTLSHRDLTQLQSGARIEIVQEKRSPLDFVLWKKAKIGEPSWPSPWGEGRPGWHIECSAMSTACLGDIFDIHGGGSDLIFPHHENERAQAMCATDKGFANTWMHIGFIQVDKEKMSKSLNNFFTIQEVIAKYDPEIVRYFLLASHYHSPVNYSEDQLIQAKSSLERLYTALRNVEVPAFDLHQFADNNHVKRFLAAMNDDFNTPVALAVLFELVHAANLAREKNDNQLNTYAAILKGLANIFGLLERHPEDFLQGKGDVALIESLIQQRETARVEKNWARADEIRNQLVAMGIVLDDTAKGTIWRKG